LNESHRALELDQLSPIMNLHLGWHYLYSEQYDLALDQLSRTLELDPSYGLAYWYLGLVYKQKGMYEEALRELRTARGFLKTNLNVYADIGRVHGRTGRRTEAEKAISWLKRESARRYVNPYQIALIYIGLGENDRAFDCLDRSVSERSDMLVYLKTDFRLNPVRADARFRELERRVSIPV
jgi:tetratricopeptide (TPR) repeat protein